ncbi:MAG: SWIM zinc finger family protein [Nitrospiraceae bacterium]
MIESVVEPGAFQMGNQYLADNRVRLVEADDVQISSAVIGRSGLYEQTIRLKDGYLVTKCSCTLTEEPMCRHCVAVLLECYRWTQRRSQKPREFGEARRQGQPVKSKASLNSVADIKLSDIMIFMEWLQPAMEAIEQAQPLPEIPENASQDVSSWIQTFRYVDERRRESEKIQMALEADMRDRETYLGSLSNQLQTTTEEAKTAQAACKDMQQELGAYKAVIAKVADLSDEMGKLDGKMKAVAGELIEKGTQLDTLAVSFREMAATLKALTKSPRL